MTRNTALPAEAPPDAPNHQRPARSIVLIGLMGAGKTSIGRRLAARLGLPFRDADAEIERAAGCTIADIFAHYGEPAFRDGERRVIGRLLAGRPIVLATGGGAWMDPATRAAVRRAGIAVWLRAPIPVLVRRVSGRDHRPLLREGNPLDILTRLAEQRHPRYAEADIVVECGDEPPETTTARVLAALDDWRPVQRQPVALAAGGYDVMIGADLLGRAGALLAPVLPGRRAVIVTDEHVAKLHLDALQAGLAGFDTGAIIVPAGESSKSLASYERVMDDLLARGIDRRTAVIALGGGVVGDLAGFVAATALRGLPFVQVPTTLLAQVDSSVGGKTGVNTRAGKNLVGAFHQPRAVLADTSTLATLPPRELRAGYAEIVKAGLIADADFYAWCETHGAAVVGGDAARQAEAIARACAFKAEVVGADEREERADDGRALLNLGHTFAHALEAECGYGGALLHGEAVAVGLGLAFRLSARLGLCPGAVADRVIAHVAEVGLPAELRVLNRRFSAERLIAHMRRDKKARDGALRFVLARGIGAAFTADNVAADAVADVLRAEGCDP